MKTKQLVTALVCLLATNVTMNSFAQEHIKAQIKKCENMDVIDANIVRNKKTNANSDSDLNSNSNSSSNSNLFTLGLRFNNDSIGHSFPSGSQIYLSAQSIINITLKYTSELEKELVAAFRKDQEVAIREVEQKKDGKVTHMLYQFEDSEYSFTIKNDTINIRATEGRINIIPTVSRYNTKIYRR